MKGHYSFVVTTAFSSKALTSESMEATNASLCHGINTATSLDYWPIRKKYQIIVLCGGQEAHQFFQGRTNRRETDQLGFDQLKLQRYWLLLLLLPVVGPVFSVGIWAFKDSMTPVFAPFAKSRRTDRQTLVCKMPIFIAYQTCRGQWT